MMPIDKNFKLVIEYDGSAYHGWQRQKADVTIQGKIEAAINKLTGKQISLIGSGRTDAGVHAMGQVANFHCETRLSPETVQRGLNALLPDDIVILDCGIVPERFHARFDAKTKTYRYSILNRPFSAAIGRQYAWYVQQPLNKAAMRLALQLIVGIHDFKAFEGTGSPRAHTIRHLLRADLLDQGNGRFDFFFTANGFLKHMVRNIVGTLVDVGRGKIGPEAMESILKAADRSLAGATAPGPGLCLMRVCYDDGEPIFSGF
jgi:tRNA pseudouridine38-40 synthase